MNLNEWAAHWGVPGEAVEDLRRRLGAVTDKVPPGVSGNSESARQGRIRVEASEKYCRLWRNNVGVTPHKCGTCGATRQPVRYGLCNDSTAQNRRLKSSDLIGIRPMRVQEYDVGRVVGVFMAREVKRAGWQYTGTADEVAQLAFLNLVLALGGDAAFANDEGTIAPGVPGLIDLTGNSD